jgi:predicted GNAT superfamily acetyltransferase
MDVRPLTTPAEMAAVEQLAGTIWQTDGAGVAPRELLRALAVTGGYVAGAYERDRLVGFAVGLLGRDGNREELHSHVTGVHPDAQGTGVGYRLKLDQRQWALDHGIGLITWTFDPLVRRNAVFNLAKLGAMVGDYLVDFYGEMHDGVNAGHGSDRWWVRWELRSGRVVSALAGTRKFIKPVGSDILCATPADIEALRRTDPRAARRWRTEVSGVVRTGLDIGRTMVGITEAGEYVLRKQW